MHSDIAIHAAGSSKSDRGSLLMRNQIVWGALFIAVLTFVVYYPSLRGGFLMDDDGLITKNRLVQAPDGLARFWFSTVPTDYWPVTNSTFWFDWRLWGTNATGYRVTNLILHIADTLLIWLLLRRLEIPGAYWAALLFAVHPVNVESVAWVSQRKNLLAMLFFLSSLLCYLKYITGRETIKSSPQANPVKWYWLSLFVFLLAMLSKGSVAILPLVLLLIIWWHQGWITKRDALLTIPFWLIAAVFTGVNIWFQTHGENTIIRQASIIERILGAAAVIWFYLGKAFVPVGLSFNYPQWDIQPNQLRWWLPLATAVGVTAFLWWQRRRTWGRTLLFAWLFYCVALLPVMGFTDVGYMKYSLVADHYQHIAILSVIALVGATGWWLYHHVNNSIRWVCIPIGALILGSSMLLSWQQNQLYGNSVQLYEATLRQNPDSWLAEVLLAQHFSDDSDYQAAISLYQHALQLHALGSTSTDSGSVDGHPGVPMPHAAFFEWAVIDTRLKLGLVLVKAGQLSEAIDQYHQILKSSPDNVSAHSDLANTLVRLDRLPEAIEQYQQALQFQPNAADIQCNLAIALARHGDYDEANQHFQTALRLDPDHFSAHNNYANMLARTGRLAEAVKQFKEALRLQPDYPEIHCNLATALATLNDVQQASDHFQTALQLKPDYAEAHNQFGDLLLKNRQTTSAIQHFQQAIRLRPNYPEALNNMGVALAQTNKVESAIQYFLEAIRLKPQYLQAYANLTRAYADADRPTDAIATAQKMLDLANSTGQKELAQQMESWLTNYNSQQSDMPTKK
jgi:tetratricopeptide (TPR) repeat protein